MDEVCVYCEHPLEQLANGERGCPDCDKQTSGFTLDEPTDYDF